MNRDRVARINFFVSGLLSAFCSYWLMTKTYGFALYLIGRNPENLDCSFLLWDANSHWVVSSVAIGLALVAALCLLFSIERIWKAIARIAPARRIMYFVAMISAYVLIVGLEGLLIRHDIDTCNKSVQECNDSCQAGQTCFCNPM